MKSSVITRMSTIATMGITGEVRRRRCEHLGRCPSPAGTVGSMRLFGRKSCPPWSVPAMTASAGVVPLLGGVARGTDASLLSLTGLVDVSWRKPRFGVGSTRWRRPRRRHSVESIAFGDTAWRFLVALLRCSSLSTASSGAQCTPLSASPRRCLLGTDRVPPSSLLRWCVDKESPL
jgi:hypothetical protein